MQEKDYKTYFHAVLAIHATFMVLIWLLIITVLLPAYHKNIKTNEDFVYEFNTTVGQDLYQKNINAIKSITPGYNLTAKEYATVWQFADKYDISKFPEYVGSSLEQTKASQDLMAQINAASEYLKHNAMNPATASTRLNQAFAINTNNVVNILQSNRKGRYRMPLKAIDNTSEPMPDSVFLYEFNQFFGPEPYKTSVLEIQAIAPRYKFKPEEWAILWTFADRYNIAKFPTYTGDISEQQAASQNFLAQILTAHEYIRNNDMDKESSFKHTIRKLIFKNQMHTAGPNKNHMVTFKSTAPKQSLRRPIFLRNMHYELHGSILAFYWFHFGLLMPEKVSKNGKIY